MKMKIDENEDENEDESEDENEDENKRKCVKDGREEEEERYIMHYILYTLNKHCSPPLSPTPFHTSLAPLEKMRRDLAHTLCHQGEGGRERSGCG